MEEEEEVKRISLEGVLGGSWEAWTVGQGTALKLQASAIHQSFSSKLWLAAIFVW
jgi:hypothetical protein